MALLPYIDIPPIDLKILELQPFGILVASGVLLATWMCRKYAERNDLDEEVLRWLGIRLLIWGWISCHVFNTFFYEWDRFRDEPILMLKVWDGISSWGGVIGGATAFFIYARIKKLDTRRWADLCAYGAAGGWLLGRLACAVVHDHLGYPSDFPLAIDFPSGRYRIIEHGAVIFHNKAPLRADDLGLYEFLVLVPIFLSVLLLERWKGRWPGFLMGFLGVAYTVPRFLLEFLRRTESDPRYGGLTFAQWCCMAAFLGCLYLLVVRPKPPEVVAEAQVVDEKPPAPAKKRKPAAKSKKGKKRN